MFTVFTILYLKCLSIYLKIFYLTCKNYLCINLKIKKCNCNYFIIVFLNQKKD